MQTLMVSMNIASNGRSMAPETLRELHKQISAMQWEGARIELAYHRQLWRLSGFDNYQFTLSRRGVGVRDNDVRVRVVNGALVSAHRLDEQGFETRATPVTGPDVGTIDDYFQRIDRELCQSRSGMKAYYHPQYGYPMSFRTVERILLQDEVRQFA